MEPMIVLDPTAESMPANRPRAPRRPDLAGVVVGLVDISKPRGDVYLDTVAALLEERGITVARYRKPTHTRPAPLDLRREITATCGAVIQALAD